MTTNTEDLGEGVTIQGDLSDFTVPVHRGLSLMEELRSQMAQRNELELSNPFTNVQTGRYKELFSLIDDAELQGSMMMFSYMHNCEDNDLVKHSQDNSASNHVLSLLDELRSYIQLRMHPVQDDYISTELFENCDSAYDLKTKLGDRRLRGALTVFNILHPEEVKAAGTAPISFTLFYGPPPRSPAHGRLADSPIRNRSATPSRQPHHRTPATAPPRARAPLRASGPAASNTAARALFTN